MLAHCAQNVRSNPFHPRVLPFLFFRELLLQIEMLGNRASKKDYRSGGNRGGQESFKWEDVKSDKDRENYLGHSAMVRVEQYFISLSLVKHT